MAFTINLKSVFEKIGLFYTIQLNSLIRKQQGIDGTGYAPVMRKVKSHNRKGKFIKKYERTSERLVDKGIYNQNAFVFSSDPATLIIEGNNDPYSGGVTYADITAFNDKDSPYLTGKHGTTIKAIGPKLFPWTEKEFLDSYASLRGQDLAVDIEPEVQAQVEEQLQQEITNQIQIKLS